MRRNVRWGLCWSGATTSIGGLLTGLRGCWNGTTACTLSTAAASPTAASTTGGWWSLGNNYSARYGGVCQFQGCQILAGRRCRSSAEEHKGDAADHEWPPLEIVARISGLTGPQAITQLQLDPL